MIRPPTAADRAKLLAITLGDPRPLDSPNHRLQFSDDGEGLAIWVDTGQNAPATLGEIFTKRPGNFRLRFALALACAQEAEAAGYTSASFIVNSRPVLTAIQRAFRISPTPHAIDPRTNQVVEWHIEVKLADAISQVERYLA